MTLRCVCVRAFVIAGLAAVLPAGAGAQQSPWPAPPPTATGPSPWPDPPQIMREEPTTQAQPPRTRAAPAQQRTQRPLRPTAQQPDLDDEDQLSPRQLGQPAQRQQQQPATTGAVPRQDAPQPTRERSARAAAATGPTGRALACGGVFAKDSSHLKLAMTYDSKNITFAEVAGPENSKLMASVLFPNDPKRRLEVLWDNPGSRAGTQLIVINGQSTWTAPKGLKLGMALAALEKANGRPFRIKGFGQDGTAQVVNWQGGALNSLPGGCKVGIFLSADPQAPPEARGELPADKEFQSSDVNVRALKPVIAEILLGY
jgi:hypothetical protein